MSLDVFLAQDLPQSFHDSLQQIIWEFPLNLHLQSENEALLDLPAGSVFVDCEGAKMMALPGQTPLLFSWKEQQKHWRSEASKIKASPLIRALGRKPGEWVVDATCGTGRDASYLLHHGLNVQAFERNKAVFFLLKFSQSIENFLLERLEVNFGQAAHKLARGDGEHSIYFDPMFDDGQKRKARAKKKMEVFHALIGLDGDALDEALSLRKLAKRLVIKRSPRDGALLEKPNNTWQTKSVRFDLYL
jgi:hypothetical protein